MLQVWVKVAVGSFADFLERAANVLMGLESESFVCSCWKVWQLRNFYIHGGLNHLLDNWFCIVMVVGGLVRDCHGEFCWGFAAASLDGSNVLRTKLVAICSGLLLAAAKGMVYLTIASDSQEAVNMINGTDGWLSNLGNLVDDVNTKILWQMR
ncbi:unnamed protein product [Prunus armeniaca]